MDKKKAIICDLDGTLADASRRLHYLKLRKKDWKNFFLEAKDDSVNEWCNDLMLAMHKQDYKILFVTGRPEDQAAATIEWMTRHTHFTPELNLDLFMRPRGDRREDTIVKEEIYKAHIEPIYKVAFAIDDRPRIIKLWRKLGIAALLCDEWES